MHHLLQTASCSLICPVVGTSECQETSAEAETTIVASESKPSGLYMVVFPWPVRKESLARALVRRTLGRKRLTKCNLLLTLGKKEAGISFCPTWQLGHLQNQHGGASYENLQNEPAK